jgi:hypothetical protein
MPTLAIHISDTLHYTLQPMETVARGSRLPDEASVTRDRKNGVIVQSQPLQCSNLYSAAAAADCC